MLRDFAVNESSTLRWNFQQDVVKYSSLNINHIGICRRKVEDFGLDAAVDLLFEMRMKVSSVNWAGGFTGSDGRSLVDAIEDAREAIRFAATVGAQTLVVHPGGRNNHTDRHARRIFCHALETILPHAEDYGVRLAIEPMSGICSRPWTFMSNFKDAMDLVEEYPSNHLGLVADLFHCGLYQPLIKQFQRLAERVFLVQIADRRTHKSTSRRLPGEGNVDIEQWLQSLSQAGVRCPVELEVYGDVNKAVSYRDRLAMFNQFVAEIGSAVGRLESESDAIQPATFPLLQGPVRGSGD